MDLMPLYTRQKQKAVTARLAFDERSLREELKYLRDPLKLAEYVDSLLRKNGFDKAAELVRMAGNSIPCTVSWNHLISYEMSQGRVNGAVKLYNEVNFEPWFKSGFSKLMIYSQMKKRAQLPDSRTFTILFRGFAYHPEYPHSLDRALSIYQSMFAEKSPVKPSIIHTNAVLNVCARAMDVDAMLGVAAKLPTRGAGAPNKVTFTTILNAIRTATIKKGKALSPEKWESRQTSVSQGRMIWGEVRDRWRNRDIEVDEDMVCAMGRLLLVGSINRDYDDVLSLLEQTMGIPRQIPHLKDENDKGISDQPNRYGEPTDSTSEAEQLGSDGCTGEESKQSVISQSPSGMMDRVDEEGVLGNEFDAFDSRKIKYVHPGCNTLSMVVDACISLKAYQAAQDYWGLLSDPGGEYKITPDAENYHVYLRLLRAKRASKLSLEMLEELCYKPPGGMKVLQPKSFLIAMSTCLRDGNNPNVLAHANKMARIMFQSLEKPDVRALGMYLSLALTDRHLQWKSLMEVLRGCEIGVRNLRSFLAYGEESDMKGFKRDREEEMIQFVSKLARAFQTALSLGKGQMSFEEEKFCRLQMNKMRDWMLRMRRMGRGKERQDEKRSNDEGVRKDEEEENDRGRTSNEVAHADGSTERVDAGNRSKKDEKGRLPWTVFRGDQKSDMPAKPKVFSTEDLQVSDRWPKLFLGSNYRPSSIYNYRRTVAHQMRMKTRSDEVREKMRKRIDKDEPWWWESNVQ